jgi:subtilisin family serine protease
MRHTSCTSFVFVAVLTAVAASGHAATKMSPALERSIGSANPDRPLTAWVFLTDKVRPSSAALLEMEARLTPHALARRERNRGAGPVVDVYDVPVDAAHIQAVRNTGVRVRNVSRWLNAVAIEALPSRVHAVAALPMVARMDVMRSGRSPQPEIEAASRVPPAQPAPGVFALDYGSSLSQNQLINVPAMHNLGYHGEGVIIAVLDTGFNNLTHPAFQDLDVLVTHDFVNGDSVVSDQGGQMGSGAHGATVMGTLAGYAPGELIGPAFGATYLLAKTENTQWERHIEEHAWIAAAEWADSIGADLISSALVYLGGFTHGETGYTWMDMDGATALITVGADIAASRGILIINAAGNGGFVSEPANTLGAPADGDMVLTVGATDAGGARGVFSSVGKTTDGRIKPDVMAMGQGVYTVNSFDDSYTTVTGTSQAVPLVAGAAALLLQARPFASNIMIMNSLRETANQSATPDRLYGWGVINALAAMNDIPSGVGDTPHAARASLGPIYPNPFNPATTIEYDLALSGPVTIAVYNVAGERIATLVDREQAAGHYTIAWNAAGVRGATLASGVYLLSLTAGDTHASRKLVLLK